MELHRSDALRHQEKEGRSPSVICPKKKMDPFAHCMSVSVDTKIVFRQGTVNFDSFVAMSIASSFCAPVYPGMGSQYSHGSVDVRCAPFFSSPR